MYSEEKNQQVAVEDGVTDKPQQAKTSISGRSLPVQRPSVSVMNVVGKCPVCGGEVVEMPDRYLCRR